MKCSFVTSIAVCEAQNSALFAYVKWQAAFVVLHTDLSIKSSRRPLLDNIQKQPGDLGMGLQ